MTKEELSALVDRVNILWRSDITLADRKEMKRVWWAFLHDLPADECERYVDGLNLRGSWAPKPGDIRRTIVLGEIPMAMDCWTEMIGRFESIASGRWEIDEVHPLTELIIRRLGDEAARMHTNGDRNAFNEVYADELGKWIDQKCRLSRPPN